MILERVVEGKCMAEGFQMADGQPSAKRALDVELTEAFPRRDGWRDHACAGAILVNPVGTVAAKTAR
jgi:hypothetical protein